MKFRTTVSGRTFRIEVDHDQLVWVDGRPIYVSLERLGGLPLYALTLGDNGYLLFVEREQEGYQVEVQGRTYAVQVMLDRPYLEPRHLGCSDKHGRRVCVKAPLAGRLLARWVAVGDRVEAGQVVAVVESMKMQIELRAPHGGVVEEVHLTPGTDVTQDASLVTIRTESDG